MLPAVLVSLTVKVSVALLVIWALTRAMGRCSAASRHLVWTLALVSMFVLPAAHLVGLRWDLAVLPARAPVRELQLIATQSVARTNEVSRAEKPFPVSTVPNGPMRIDVSPTTPWTRVDLASILLLVWLGGGIVGLLRFIIGLLSVRRIVRRASRMTSPEWMATLGDAALALGLTTPVQVKSSIDTSIPVACGIATPTILVPPDATGWSADRRRVVCYTNWRMSYVVIAWCSPSPKSQRRCTGSTRLHTWRSRDFVVSRSGRATTSCLLPAQTDHSTRITWLKSHAPRYHRSHTGGLCWRWRIARTWRVD